MLPISSSSFSVQAAPSVIACSACVTVMRSAAPSTRPWGVTRLTAHQAVNSGPSGVTGASEWIASATPAASALAQASSRVARSGPIVVS